jgi:hypothetical protein
VVPCWEHSDNSIMAAECTQADELTANACKFDLPWQCVSARSFHYLGPPSVAPQNLAWRRLSRSSGMELAGALGLGWTQQGKGPLMLSPVFPGWSAKPDEDPGGVQWERSGEGFFLYWNILSLKAKEIG